ncbi:hypothetical protein OIU76_021689 [Salix suchowensis]|nr:hypothetical protein OIU76_021689 [Salix suchowensis]
MFLQEIKGWSVLNGLRYMSVAQGGRGLGVGGIMGGSRAAGGAGGTIGGARATTGGNTSTSVTWVLLLLFGHLL